MKRIIAILTAMVMLLMLTACGGKGDANVVGKWQGEIDYAGIVNAFMAENDVLAVSGVTLDHAPVTVTYTFLEDGTATCELDQTALNDKMMVVLKEILAPMMGMLGGTTVEEYIANSGQTNEELIRSLFTDETYDDIVKAVCFAGTYTVNSNKLTVTADGNTAMEKVVLSDDTLTLTAPFVWVTSSEAVQTAVKTLYPLTLKKVG